MRKVIFFFILLTFSFSSMLFAEEAKLQEPSNLFAETFYANPAQLLKHETVNFEGLVFLENPNRKKNTQYSVVTDFGGSVLKSYAIPGLTNLEVAREWVADNLEVADFQGVELSRLVIPAANGESKRLIWVGQKAFDSVKAAQTEIALVQSVVESRGGDFQKMVSEAKAAFVIAEEHPPVEIKTPAQYKKEEALMLKFLDHMDIGNELFGPLQGVNAGQKISYQSFAETSWRLTNLESNIFDGQVGFWTNRVVFKGIKAPYNTVDPFIEATVAVESSGVDFKDSMVLTGGVEWRPLERNPFFSTNFRPWTLPLLKWVTSYRFVAQYGQRFHIKDEITSSSNQELLAGVTIFYEFGLDLPGVNEADPTTIPDYLRRYVWGEYFGAYTYQKTGFNAFNDFNAFILNSSVILGLKTPEIPLPKNPLIDQVVLMPYMRFEHVNNTEFNSPFQNRYSVVAGVRWMPFRTYRFKENEWLYKTKFFFEYVGIGKVQETKVQSGNPDFDVRFGVNISSNRV